MIVKLDKTEYVGGIVHLYDTVAEKLGEDKNSVSYDCKKINVATNISNVIFDYMENVDGIDKCSAGMLWCCYGPRADESLGEDEVEVQEGFIIKD